MSEQNKDLVRREAEEFVNQKNFELFDQIYHPDFRSTNPGETEGMDLNTYREVWKKIFTSFPDFHTEILDLIEVGETVVSIWRSQATFKANWDEVPANNELISWAGIDVDRFRDGKIVECITAFDNLNSSLKMGSVQAVVPATE